LANLAPATVSEGAKLKDRYGVEHVLSIPTLGDLAEIEREFGSFTALTEPSIDVLLFLLFLSLRREGKTKEQLSAGEFACTLFDVGEMFTLLDLENVRKALDIMMVKAGLVSEEDTEKSDPPSGQEEGAQSANSVKEHSPEPQSSVQHTQESQ